MEVPGEGTLAPERLPPTIIPREAPMEQEHPPDTDMGQAGDRDPPLPMATMDTTVAITIPIMELGAWVRAPV